MRTFGGCSVDTPWIVVMRWQGLKIEEGWGEVGGLKGWDREFHEKVRTFAKLKQFEESRELGGLRRFEDAGWIFGRYSEDSRDAFGECRLSRFGGCLAKF